VVCVARDIPSELYTQMFTGMAKQSERQLGAFMLLCAFEFGEAYRPDKQPLKEIIEDRNAVIHQGVIPTLEVANKFASDVYGVICQLYRKLHAKHAAHMMAVTMQSLGERRERANVPNGMRVATNSGTMFFNNAKGDAEPDFAKALDAFRIGRRIMRLR
jgi:hypothetical protein